MVKGNRGTRLYNFFFLNFKSAYYILPFCLRGLVFRAEVGSPPGKFEVLERGVITGAGPIFGAVGEQERSGVLLKIRFCYEGRVEGMLHRIVDRL